MTQTPDRMPCPKCRAANLSSSAVCWQCGQPRKAQLCRLSFQPPDAPPPPGLQPPPAQMRPPNNLVWAILATVLCCLPAGIVAIVYAAQVDGKYAGGDYAGALDSSNKAKMWSWISFAAGLVGGIIYVAILLAAGMGTAFHQ